MDIFECVADLDFLTFGTNISATRRRGNSGIFVFIQYSTWKSKLIETVGDSPVTMRLSDWLNRHRHLPNCSSCIPRSSQGTSPAWINASTPKWKLYPQSVMAKLCDVYGILAPSRFKTIKKGNVLLVVGY